jgi:hypothetical protein
VASPSRALLRHTGARPFRGCSDTPDDRAWCRPVVVWASVPDHDEQRLVDHLMQSRLRAGRRPRGAMFIDGEPPEERSARIYREVQAYSAQLPQTSSMFDGAETAQQSYEKLLRDGVAPRLREIGLRGSGKLFHFDDGDKRGFVSFRSFRYNTKAIVEFSAEVSATYKPTGVCLWSSSLGWLLPELDYGYWVLPVEAETDELVEDLVGAVRDYGLVALAAAVDQYPPPPNQLWPRVFYRPAALSRRGFTFEEMFKRYPSTVEEAFAAADGPDLDKQQGAVDFLYHVAPRDPRFAPLVVALLGQVPSSHYRAKIARMLGFLGCDPEVALSALRSAVAEDEDLEVRICASYVARLIERQVAQAQADS